MRMCCVPGCENRYSPNGIGFHHLPQGLKNEERRKLWEKNIGRPLTPKSVVCDKHFTSDQFEQNRKDGKKPLRWNAIPTVFSMKKLNKSKRLTDHLLSKPCLPTIVPQPVPVKLVGTEDSLQADFSQSPVKLVHQVVIPIERKQIQEIKRDTPPGCIPILPKYDPSSYVLVKNTEIEDYKKEIQKYKYLAETYANKINKLICVKKNLENNRKNVDLKHIFNDDQIESLHLRKKESDEINWGYKTIDKATELYKACGEDGYKAILSQKLPYPSLNLLKRIKPETFT